MLKIQSSKLKAQSSKLKAQSSKLKAQSSKLKELDFKPFKKSIKNIKGFTLLELVITVSILSIATAIAVPNFTSMVQNNRIRTTTNHIISTLQFARQTAAIERKQVTACPPASSTPESCALSQEWQNGVALLLGKATINPYTPPAPPASPTPTDAPSAPSKPDYPPAPNKEKYPDKPINTKVKEKTVLPEPASPEFLIENEPTNEGGYTSYYLVPAYKYIHRHREYYDYNYIDRYWITSQNPEYTYGNESKNDPNSSLTLEEYLDKMNDPYYSCSDLGTHIADKIVLMKMSSHGSYPIPAILGGGYYEKENVPVTIIHCLTSRRESYYQYMLNNPEDRAWAAQAKSLLEKREEEEFERFRKRQRDYYDGLYQYGGYNGVRAENKRRTDAYNLELQAHAQQQQEIDTQYQKYLQEHADAYQEKLTAWENEKTSIDSAHAQAIINWQKQKSDIDSAHQQQINLHQQQVDAHQRAWQEQLDAHARAMQAYNDELARAPATVVVLEEAKTLLAHNPFPVKVTRYLNGNASAVVYDKDRVKGHGQIHIEDKRGRGEHSRIVCINMLGNIKVVKGNESCL